MTTEQRASACLAEGGAHGHGGCRAVGRAEAFARSLHHKLRSLGGGSTAAQPNGQPNGQPPRPDSPEDGDDSWSSAPSVAHRTLSTSSVDSSSDLFYDLDFSPQSPQEEVTSQELAGMMAGSGNRDGLSLGLAGLAFGPRSNGPAGPAGPQSPQSDCSSDYFDTDCFDEESHRGAPPGPPPTEPPLPAPPDGGSATNGSALSNGTAPLVNGHGHAAAKAEAKAKRPWNRVPHRYKAGTPEAMSEVSALRLDEADDDDDDEDRPRARRATLAKLNFAKSQQTLLQEGLIEQLKQGHDIPPELKNGLCPAPEGGCPVGGRGLAAMKEAARTLEALESPVEDCDSAAAGTTADDVEADVDPAGEPAECAEPCRDCEHDGIESGDGAAPEADGHLDADADAEADADGVAAEAGHNGHADEERDGGDDGDEDGDDGPRPRIRRCSSLKTGKTPPGTPGRKKIVRFADVLGLDLADVRTFLDEIPKVPTSAYSDLRDVDQGDVAPAVGDPLGLGAGLPQLALAFHAAPAADVPPPYGVRPHVTRVLVPLFQQPGGLADFLERVRERQVCLENAVVADPALLSIAGQVRVRNLDFHKTVHLRYTTDGWRSFADLQATYVPNSCDGFSDKFTFTLFAGHTMSVGQRLEIAVRFQCKGQQYWDSNGGANYCFQCLPPSSAPPATLPLLPSLNSPCGDDGWKYLF